MAEIIHGRDHGKVDRDRYVCTHGVCGQCRRCVWKLWIGNEAGRRYAASIIRDAIVEHRCEPIQ